MSSQNSGVNNASTTGEEPVNTMVEEEEQPIPTTPNSQQLRKSVDPQRLTVRELKSILKNYVELPPDTQKKAYYVDLYNKYVITSKTESSASKDEDENAKKRKSDSVDDQQSGDEDNTQPEQKKVKPTPQSPQNEFQQSIQHFH